MRVYYWLLTFVIVYIKKQPKTEEKAATLSYIVTKTKSKKMRIMVAR